MASKNKLAIAKGKLVKCFTLISVVAIAGCTASTAITNPEAVAIGAGYQAEYRGRNEHDKLVRVTPASVNLNSEKCSPEAPRSQHEGSFLSNELLSPGDLVEVTIGTDETFSGKYEISGDGTLKVKEVASILAHGKSVSEVQRLLSQALKAGKYYNTNPNVSVRLADYGVARVFISGAVFEPGQVSIGGSAATSGLNDNTREVALGASTSARRLAHALQSSGGVRPDADLSRVELKRGQKQYVIDLRAAISGGFYDDQVVLEGDQIFVPSRGCFQQALMVPSSVSPAGAYVFMSNLTDPATSNASSAINKDTRALRYGTKMLQALVGMNCVGGAKMTNAHRSAILYSRNPVTGRSIVIERDIEDLVRNADRDEYDPYILPNDALACYDSGTTNVAKLAQSFGLVAGAVVAGRGL